MADGAGQGIGGMVGMRVVVELRERAYHVGDLPLVRGAGAHHSLFDLHGRVLANLERALRKRHERSTAGMRRGDGRADVGAKVDALDSRGIGAIALDDILKIAGDMRQAHRERTSGTGLDAAIGTTANLATPLLDNPQPVWAKPGSIPKITKPTSLVTSTAQSKAPRIIHERLF